MKCGYNNSEESKEKHIMKCECGSKRFYSHLLFCHSVEVNEFGDVIVDHGVCSADFIPNEDTDFVINNLKSPYKCVKCGKEYKEIS